jgi:hypothetical protein
MQTKTTLKRVHDMVLWKLEWRSEGVVSGLLQHYPLIWSVWRVRVRKILLHHRLCCFEPCPGIVVLLLLTVMELFLLQLALCDWSLVHRFGEILRFLH